MTRYNIYAIIIQDLRGEKRGIFVRINNKKIVSLFRRFGKILLLFVGTVGALITFLIYFAVGIFLRLDFENTLRGAISLAAALFLVTVFVSAFVELKFDDNN